MFKKIACATSKLAEKSCNSKRSKLSLPNIIDFAQNDYLIQCCVYSKSCFNGVLMLIYDITHTVLYG